MKLNLEVPDLNIICSALDAMQQTAAVVKQSIVGQVQAEQAREQAAQAAPAPEVAEAGDDSPPAAPNP